MDAWLHDLRVEWGERAYRSARAIAPLVAAGRVADLRVVGRQLATDGHSLEELLGWFELLAERARPYRAVLQHGGIDQLADGWADGIMQHEYGTQSVAPLDVLRHRLHQQVQVACSFGSRPGQLLALVVVDTDGSSDRVEEATRVARATFRSGETMAVTPTGKLLILVRRDHDLRRRTMQLSEALRQDDQSHAPVRVWIEPLAMSAEHVDSHLLGLVS